MTDHASSWLLDPEITFLNHGSFGACPIPVLEQQQEFRRQLESEPVAFFMREFEGLLDKARKAVSEFVHARPEDLVFVPNATAGVNSILNSLALDPGDELLTTDHVYNACRNALEFVAARTGARVVIAPVPFPLQDAEEVVQSLMTRVTDRTRFALVDHITSPTGLVLPVERILRRLDEKGIDCMVDGAHAPGMLDLDIGELAPAYYTGNCHKWICAPKGAAFLWVREDRQERIHPLVISHGMNSPRTDRSRFQLEFDWPGTVDPTPWFCIPAALDFMGSLFPGGFAELRQRNRDLVLWARGILCEALEIDPPPAPEDMIGTLAAVPIPDGTASGNRNPMGIDPLQDELFCEDRIEVPVIPWPAPPKRLLRVSAQAYNHEEQYCKLGDALRRRLGP